MTLPLPEPVVKDPQVQRNFDAIAQAWPVFPQWQSITTYANGWRDYAGGLGANYSPPKFYRDPYGHVFCEGLVDKNGGNYIANETIFTLPTGFIPMRNLIFTPPAAGGAAEGNAQLRVYGTLDAKVGKVEIGTYGGPANPVVWVSLAPIHFRISAV